MNRLITAIAVAGALGSAGLAATAASAQPYGYGPGAGQGRGWTSVNGQQARIDARIDRGLRDGSLTRREAARLRAEFRDIQRLEARYRFDDGRLDRREQADLSFRLQDLNRQVFAERNDWQERRYR